MVCKKCEKESILTINKEVTEKKCKLCKKKFNSRILVICGSCQAKRGNVCLTCGKKDERQNT